MPDDKTPQQPRSDVVLVTPENFNEFVEEKLGPAEGAEPEVVENESPEVIAARDLAELESTRVVEGPKEGDIDGSKVFFKGKWTNKHDFNYRLHVKTEEGIKEAKESAKAAQDKINEERAARQKAEREAEELRTKYEPPKSDEIGPEPTPEQFQNPVEYGKALKEWTTDKTRRDDAVKVRSDSAKAQAEKTFKAYQDREAAYAKENPEYQEIIQNANIQISNELRDAIIESDVAPQLKQHLAQNPDIAEKLCSMTVGGMLKAVGKLEAQLGGPEKPASKSAEPAPKAAEISKAPAPITPLGGDGSAVVRLSGSDPVPDRMTYDTWKKLRQSGKIA